MKTIFLIETNPITKFYFSDIHFGYINEVGSIKKAKHFNTYDDAQKELKNIVLGDFESENTLYLSIIKLTIKN